MSDITGSEMKEKNRHICRTNDVIGALLRVSMTADCIQATEASFVEKSWRWVRPAHISLNLDDQWVICLLNGRLFCQKTVAIFHYSPHVILIESSTEITSLELSVSSVKLCQRRFKVHFFVTIVKIRLFLACHKFYLFIIYSMTFFSKKSYFHDSVPLMVSLNAAINVDIVWR